MFMSVRSNRNEPKGSSNKRSCASIDFRSVFLCIRQRPPSYHHRRLGHVEKKIEQAQLFLRSSNVSYNPQIFFYLAGAP